MKKEETALIRVPKELKNELDGLKLGKWEPYYSVIKRLVDHYEKTRKPGK